MFGIALIVLLAVVVLYLWSVYNQLVTLKTRIGASIQEIGNQLKRQADLIPNLVASVKGYMNHEDKIFTEITDARKAVMEVADSGDAQKLVDAGSRLQSALGALRVIVEAIPQIQAAGPTMQLMNEVRDTSDKVMYSRRTLIDLTADYNIRIAIFPSSLVANLFGFAAQTGLKVPNQDEVLQVKPAETQTPQVTL